MNNTTYGALKRIVKEAREYRKIINKDFPIIGGNDLDLVQGWIDETAKEHK